MTKPLFCSACGQRLDPVWGHCPACFQRNVSLPAPRGTLWQDLRTCLRSLAAISNLMQSCLMTLAVVGLIAAFVWAYLSTQALFAPPSRPWLPAAGRLTPGVTLWKVWSGTGNAATRVGTFLRLTVRQDSPYDPSWYALELWNPQEGRFYLPQTTFQDSKEYYVREDDPALPKK